VKLAAIAIAAYGLLYAIFGGHGEQAHSKQTIYVVQRNDTLWSIGSAHKLLGEDVRDYIDQVSAVNHISDGDVVQPGETIKLP